MRLRYGVLLWAVTLCAQQWKPADNPLTTPWTADVRAENPLPEYPRPQMVRSRWTNLNGLWDYAIRPKEEGRPAEFAGKILAPFSVQSALSGVKQPLTPDQRLWYRRTFTAPQRRGERLLLHFDAVDWRSEVWVNGKSVGTHEGGYDPFTFDITNALKPAGAQELVVAVTDPTDTAMIPRGKQVLDPSGIWYTAVSGIWQTVWLEPVPSAAITELTMTPDLDAKQLRITVHTQAPVQFTATATLHGRAVGTVTGTTNREARLAVRVLEPWSPDSPSLYDLHVTLKSGDSVDSYFGMRKVEVHKDAAGFNRIFLNNHPLFLIGPLDQGWWPDGLYTAPTDAALRSDIDTLKKLGYNMMRKHVKVEPPRFYYWADKLGLAIWQDMPSSMQKGRSSAVRTKSPDDIAFTADEAAEWQHELTALMKHLMNTPSIIAWVPFNEGWGQHSTNEVLQYTKKLDASRLVDGPSGWEDRGWGDMKDMHSYPGPGMFAVMADRASVLGEFGGLGLPVKGHLWWNKRNWGYRTFEDMTKLQDGYAELINKLEPMVRQGLAAAVYTQTTDVEGEINGLMTYDRKIVKYNSEKMAEMHKRLIGLVEK